MTPATLEIVERIARECIAEDWTDHVPGYYRGMNLERFWSLAMEHAAGIYLTQMHQALVRARDGYISEQATGLPVLEKWRDETLDRLNAAIDTAATMRAAAIREAGK